MAPHFTSIRFTTHARKRAEFRTGLPLIDIEMQIRLALDNGSALQQKGQWSAAIEGGKGAATAVFQVEGTELVVVTIRDSTVCTQGERADSGLKHRPFAGLKARP